MYAFRMNEGDDLKQKVINFVVENNLQSAVIACAVGSLSQASIRMAGALPGKQDVRQFKGAFEIVSLIGTVAPDGLCHLHISISDKDGQVIGGHVKEGCIVHTTVELSLLSDDEIRFSRQIDTITGFDELSVNQIEDR